MTITILNKVNTTAAQAAAITTLEDSRGFAGIKGYVPTTNWTESPVQDINCVVGFKVSSLYKKQIEALKALNFEDVSLKSWIPSKGKNAVADASEQFALCVELLIDSKQKMFDKSVSEEDLDAHRKAHHACYLTIHNSIKVNLITEKNEEGLQRPVLAENGLPTVKSILIPYTYNAIKTRIAGIRKVKKSGSKVLMDNAIQSALPSSMKFSQVSLKEGSFESVHVSSKEILETELHKAEELKTLTA